MPKEQKEAQATPVNMLSILVSCRTNHFKDRCNKYSKYGKRGE